MIRQNEFYDIAISRAVDYLKENPFAGEKCEGELLEKLSKVKINDLKYFTEEIKKILSCALIENKTYEWLLEEERKEFEEVINDFNSLLGDDV